jgi:hypothetical protein
MAMNLPLHPGLAGYLQMRGQGKPTLQRDGSVALVIDRRFRVLCRPLPGGALLLESQLGELPAMPRERHALLARILEALGDDLVDHAETISLADDGGALVQQQFVDAGDAKLFEAGLESHVNALARWRGMMGLL